MHKPFLATLTVFAIQHDRSYIMPGRRLDDQCLPRAAAVHLIPADPWSREWGQPQALEARKQYWQVYVNVKELQSLSLT